jgi:hypothetical protein
MIRLCLINGRFSSLDDNLDLDTLRINKEDIVVISCDEYHPTIGNLENAAADYVSSLLPYGFKVQWDGSDVVYRNQRIDPKISNPKIRELRFKLVLKKSR